MNYLETLEKADINVSTIGDNEIIAAPGDGKYIAIDFILLVVSGTDTVTFKHGGTAYGGPIPFYAGGSLAIENAIHNEHGIITLDNNANFVINSSSGIQLGGFIRYRIINK